MTRTKTLLPEYAVKWCAKLDRMSAVFKSRFKALAGFITDIEIVRDGRYSTTATSKKLGLKFQYLCLSAPDDLDTLTKLPPLHYMFRVVDMTGNVMHEEHHVQGNERLVADLHDVHEKEYAFKNTNELNRLWAHGVSGFANSYQFHEMLFCQHMADESRWLKELRRL